MERNTAVINVDKLVRVKSDTDELEALKKRFAELLNAYGVLVKEHRELAAWLRRHIDKSLCKREEN